MKTKRSFRTSLVILPGVLALAAGIGLIPEYPAGPRPEAGASRVPGIPMRTHPAPPAADNEPVPLQENSRDLEELLSNDDLTGEEALARLRAFAKKDAATVAGAILAARPHRVPGQALDHVIAVWVDRSPQDALAWLEQAGRDDVGPAVVIALSAFARENPAAAAGWLAGHPDHASIDAWQAVLAAWGEQEPREAHDWVTAHLDPEMEAALRPTMLLSFREPVVTAAILESGVPDETLVRLARATMQDDADFSRNLILQLRDERERQRWLSRLARRHNGAEDHGMVQPHPAAGF